jgi:two-component system chemotaxis response regulator CheY
VDLRTDYSNLGSNLNGLSILLIEDDSATREVFVAMLEELGIFSVHQKSNGMDALRFIDQNPDWRGVILCDWNMPRMSGAAFYRQIKHTHPDTPFIMVTGRNDEDSILFARDNGIYAYLLKPVSMEEMQRKISKVVVNHAVHLAAMKKKADVPLYTI